MRIIDSRFLIAVGLLSGCGSSEGEFTSDEATPATSEAKITHGIPLTPGSQFADDVILTREGCRGTLLTNSWVLTAQHCEHAYSGDGQPEFVWIGSPDQHCTSDSQCVARNTKCMATNWGNYCGAIVRRVYRNPMSNPDPGLGNQVDLWQLETPIYSGVNPAPYSIAQQVYFGSKSSLLNKTITIVGHGDSNLPSFPLLAQKDFKISGVSTTWSYTVSNSAGDTLQGGDSGGPGYYFTNGVNYLTGVTQTGNSQHDLVETWTGGSMPGWIDDTMFDSPKALQLNAQGLAMALTPTGAVQAFVRNGNYYFSQCDREPCDSRGTWSTPGLFATGRTAAPAIAIDNFPGWGAGATAFVADASGITGYAVVKGAYLGSTSLGGTCTSPAGVDSRPSTNPPVLDVLCTGTDGAAWINQRVNGAWNGYYSLGKPSAGIRSGAAPAVVSSDWNTTYVAVVGSDGNIYIQPGAGGVGWTGWTSLGTPSGKSLRSVALASYAPERLDVIAIDSGGRMWHRIGTGNTLARKWSSAWTPITIGTWAPTIAPFAASYSSRYGLMNVGGIGADGNAFIQRYSDW